MTIQENKRQQKLERDWKTMIVISHDFFHSWRRAVSEKYGDAAMEQLTYRFWELIGQNTAAQYKKGKVDSASAEQLARAVARSSEIMGETVRVEQEGDAWLLIHDACPWIKSYQQAGYPGQCRSGCDKWFSATVAELASGIAVETTACLADGDKWCIRKFYTKLTE
ncbi:L-2-amino-thiazoline-4-carboxylic acid hydrolase [Desulfoscipio gibsoniae]|uniref:L-2-amino-thiazoline-4-carboxylic acid hydrolase n=1 Tax=Desulfoscipio gibsoniae DSM 7213 TaxID=767817 RepID=R4KDJ6_9FIRM|nr:L-2-amino-thiazoline-4-carboxylic acid hydrolase [Desulfoscipio gibsoniae]AGL00654.1 hypothetical protein Desgi_1129 [Desulfoscipio gibsoniae DSM 7213]